MGPEVSGYKVVVLGDSRAARVGGPPIDNPTDSDTRCERSKDSIAAEIELLTGKRTRNLACPSATLNSGIEGEQPEREQPAQLGLLKQMRGVETVVLMIGPNDLWWSSLLGYCYIQADCSDNLTSAAFESQLDQFTRDYYERLIPDLRDLPNHPNVVVVLSYSALDPEANCPDTRGPEGTSNLHDAPPGGQPGDKIRMLEERNQDLNDVLRDGAEAAGFRVVEPKLKLLCAPDPDGLGPHLQGLSDTHPFHPTGLGSLHLAYQVVQALPKTK